MSKYILGSGLVGLLAKDILGEEWDIIPQSPSRYYSWPVALADDFITISPKTLSASGGLSRLIVPGKTQIQKAFSYGGELIFAPLQWVADTYTNKVYDNPVRAFLRVNPMEVEVSGVSCHRLYGDLLEKHIDLLSANREKYGEITEISNGEIKTEKTILPYDEILSTIPLDGLFGFMGVKQELESKDVWLYHVKTSQLNFESADQVLVVDPELSFFKVNKIGHHDYVFFCLDKIETPTEYFGAFTNNNLAVVNPGGTLCKSFIPLSFPPPNLQWLKDNFNIQCVGSHAQWDDLADMGTCLMRIFSI